MRLLALAVSFPAMFIVMGITIILAPTCNLSLSLLVGYAALTPLLYYARPFNVRPKYLLVSLGGLSLLWISEVILTPYLARYQDLMKFLVDIMKEGCPQWRVYFAISTVVLAPLVEETIFRALLFTEIEKRAGVAAAYLGSSLAFAAVHGVAQLLPMYFAMGLLLGFAYKRGGFLSAVIVHSLNNLVAITPYLDYHNFP